MNSEECPRLGPYCIAMIGLLNPRTRTQILKEHILMTEQVSKPTDVKITPMAEVIDMLLENERSMRSTHHHPVDQTVIGIESEALSKIQVVLARTQGRQRRIDASTIREEAEQETAVTRKLAKTLKPLAQDITKNKASSEQVMKTLLDQEDPNKARKLLFTQVKAPTTLLVDNEVLLQAREDVQTGSIVVPGQAVHQIKVDMMTSARESTSLTARLMELESASPLFKASDCGIQLIHIDVLDKTSFFLLNQCMSLGWPASITVSIDISLNARGVTYRASLLSIQKKSELATQLAQAVQTRTLDMFST